MKLRKKTATLLIAILMISTFAVATSAEVFVDYRYTEATWGTPSTQPLPEGESLAIEVWYKGSKAYFRATIPESYDPEASLASFTFDVDNDGMADFQIQYRGTVEGWMYSGVDILQTPLYGGTGSGWVKDIGGGESNWQPVPSEFILTNNDKVFTLKLPVALLSETYKFGFQACREGPWQIFYSNDPAHLWYDAILKDYIHSTYYVEMDLPPLKIGLVPGNGKGLDKPLPNDNFAKGRNK